jgi:hypothetical protein
MANERDVNLLPKDAIERGRFDDKTQSRRSGASSVPAQRAQHTPSAAERRAMKVFMQNLGPSPSRRSR